GDALRRFCRGADGASGELPRRHHHAAACRHATTGDATTGRAIGMAIMAAAALWDARSGARPVFARLAAALLAFFCLLSPALAAPQFPALTGRVVDGANILSDATKSDLTEKLAALESKTSRQLVVVTLPSLQGYDIADFGYQLGRAWGIGQKGLNNGVLLIVAPTEHKVRIEVGYNLEPILTDALS